MKDSEVRIMHPKGNNEGLLMLGFGVILPIIVFLATIMLGRYSLSISKIIDLVREAIVPGTVEVNKVDVGVFWVIRLPRAIFACLAGGALGIAGCVFQGVFRNPLVSDDIMGVSSGATLGAAISIILLQGSDIVTQFYAFIGGLVTMFLIFKLATVSRSESILSIILAGVIINALARSLISILKYVADPTSTLITLDYWLMGSLNKISWSKVYIFMPPFLICLGVVLALRWQVNLLSLGDEEASALGVNVKLVRGILIVACTILVALVVSTTGIISWIGLISPHLVRLIMGNNHSKAIPLSFSAGSVLMMLSDTMSRSLLSVELPLSAVISVLGAPMLGYLLWKSGSRSW